MSVHTSDRSHMSVPGSHVRCPLPDLVLSVLVLSLLHQALQAGHVAMHGVGPDVGRRAARLSHDGLVPDIRYYSNMSGYNKNKRNYTVVGSRLLADLARHLWPHLSHITHIGQISANLQWRTIAKMTITVATPLPAAALWAVAMTETMAGEGAGRTEGRTISMRGTMIAAGLTSRGVRRRRRSARRAAGAVAPRVPIGREVEGEAGGRGRGRGGRIAGAGVDPGTGGGAGEEGGRIKCPAARGYAKKTPYCTQCG